MLLACSRRQHSDSTQPHRIGARSRECPADPREAARHGTGRRPASSRCARAHDTATLGSYIYGSAETHTRTPGGARERRN
eukprot:scaffold9960_cov71-Phaeocystis_antarctica.AAC.4